MALVVKAYQSNQGIQNGQDPGPAARYRSPGDFMSASKDRMLAPALNHMAQGLDKLAGAMHQRDLDKQQLDMINDVENEKLFQRQWMDDYRQNNHGANGIDADKAYIEFNKPRAEALKEKWAGNLRAQTYLAQHMGPFSGDALNTMRDYGNSQSNVYRQQTFQGTRANALNSAAQDPANWERYRADAERIYREINSGAPESFLQAGVRQNIDTPLLGTAIAASIDCGDVDGAQGLLDGWRGGGSRVEGARFALPMDKHTHITSPFGSRTAPNTPKGKGSSNHQGIDLRVPVGTPVKAISGGTVSFAGDKGGYGVTVVIKHDDGTTTSQYGHLSQFNVQPGMKVNAGDVIALSGNTGKSTGPHLDLKVTENGQYIDPAPLLGLTRQGPSGKVGGGSPDPELAIKFQRQIDTARAQQNKQYKAEVEQLPGLAKDEMAMILDTGVDNPDLAEKISRAEGMGLLPEGAAEKYEADKQKTLEARRWITDPVNLGLSIPEQIAKARKDLAPDPEKDKGQWLAKSAYQKTVVDQLEKQQAQLNADPVAFVAEQADKVLRKEAAQGYLDPDDKAAAFKARVEISKRLAMDNGMGLAGLENFPLSQNLLKEVGQRINAAGNAQERIGVLNQLYEEFGDYSEAAFKQLKVDYSELLAVEATRSGDQRLARAARMAVNRPEKITKMKPTELETIINEAVDDTDFGELLGGRVNNSFNQDQEARRKLDGLRDFAYGIGASMIESGYSEGQVKKEVKYALQAMTAGTVAINEDYASIYLTTDESGRAGDRSSILAGLNYLSRDFGDDFYWINDGDDHFVLASRLTGQQKVFDGVRSVRVSRMDAAYIGGLSTADDPARVAVFTADVPYPVLTDSFTYELSPESQTMQGREKRAREVIERMRKAPPDDDHSIFIESVRANSLKEVEAKGGRPGRPVPAEGPYINDSGEERLTALAGTGEVR